MQLNSRIDNLKQLVEVIAVERSSKLIASQQAISDENEVMREKRSVAEERFADLRGLARNAVGRQVCIMVTCMRQIIRITCVGFRYCMDGN